MKKEHSLPNIILFNPDQWRGDVLGHLDNPAAQTPTLDQIVETDGISFSNAFCQNPVCVPSRCSFMTGLYPHNRGHRTMYHMLHPEQGEKHLLQTLRKQGYHTWWGGKNDLFDTPSTDFGASEVDTRFLPKDSDYQRWNATFRKDSHIDLSWRPKQGASGFYSMFRGKLEKENESVYLDRDWANVFGAKEFIESYSGKKPFCLFLSLSYPHPPYAAEEPYFSAINRNKLPPRVPPPKNWKDKPSILKGIYNQQNLSEWTESEWDELRATYYASCMRVDDQLGILIESLKTTYQYDNTAIFCFSDHGDFTGDYGLVEKNQNTFEDCLTRVPLIIKPPKHIKAKPGVQSKALVELIDIPATIYDLTGITPDYDHFGKSLLPVITQENQPHRSAVFCEGGRRPHEKQASEISSSSATNKEELYWPRVSLQSCENPLYHNQAVMCRTEKWKYVRRQGEADELYDLVNDPQELKNKITSSDPAIQKVLSELKALLLDWYQLTSDTVPQQVDQR